MEGSIPFLNLVAVHAELEEELCSIFRQTLKTAAFVGGPLVEHFESEFAKFCEVQECVGVASGTDALRFALIAGGVTPGCIVITVPNTFIATAEAISQAGGTPCFVDVDARTYNMDPEKLRVFLEFECMHLSDEQRTVHRASGMPVQAVVPVHLYGQMADMDAIDELAQHYDLTVIEDACQAHGAEYFSRKEQRWRKAGSMGKAAAFSFYPGKNLGGCGEGGAITTDDPVLARTARLLRDHGQLQKYHHQIEGFNGRLDSLQAAILNAKLRHLSGWNLRRRNHAQRYAEMLTVFEDCIRHPYEPSWCRAVYHLYVVEVDRRDAIRQELNAEGIETGIHYPVPLHLQKAYARLGYGPGAFPVVESAARRILSLPIYPELTSTQQSKVVGALAGRCVLSSSALTNVYAS